VDFNVAFHPILVPDFIDMLLVKIVAAQHREYLVEESMLDI
jgi:hypothetical protein